jgi:DNA-binding response OmpR family regulator
MSRGTILIVENEPFIALELDDGFRDSGYTPLCAPNVAFAVQWLDQNSPTAAIINYEGNNPTSQSLSDRLSATGAITIVYTGVPIEAQVTSGLPPDFIWISKPSSFDKILTAVERKLHR